MKGCPAFKRLWLVTLIFFFAFRGWALPYYWVGQTAAGNWSDPQNWALTSGGTGGAGVPGPGDDAIFDAQGTAVCAVDIADVTIGSLLFDTGYAGFIDLNGDTLNTTSLTNRQTPMQNGVVRILGGDVLIQTSELAIALIGTSNNLQLASSTLQNVSLTITGTSSSSVTATVFTAIARFTRTGLGNLIFDSNSFQGITIRNQNNAGEVRCQGTETYNGSTFFINDALSPMQLAYAGGPTTFMNDVSLQNLQNSTISLGAGGGTATAATTARVEMTDTGLGTFDISHLTAEGWFVASGTTLTGTTRLTMSQCVFNRTLDLSLPTLVCGSGNRFNNEFLVELTGSEASVISGTFDPLWTCSILRSGSGSLTLQSMDAPGFVNLNNTNNAGTILGRGTNRHGNFYVYNLATASINLASEGSTVFLNYVEFANFQNGTISTGAAGGTATLEATARMQITDTSIGTIALNNLIANGSINPINRTLTGSLALSLSNCTFNNRFWLTLPVLNCGSGNRFNNEFLVELTGSEASVISGTFDPWWTCSILRSGSGSLTLQAIDAPGFVNLNNTNNAGTILGRGTNRHGNFYVYNLATASINLASEGSTVFLNYVEFANFQNGTISTGAAGGTATLEATARMQITDTSIGTIALNNLIANGSINPINRTLTGSLALSLSNCTFNNRFWLTLPVLNCGSGNRFNNEFLVELTGSEASVISGTFDPWWTCSILRSGSGSLTLQAIDAPGFVNLNNTNNAGTILGRGTNRHGNFYVYNLATASINLASEGSTVFLNYVEFANFQNGTISTGAAGGTATLEATARMQITDTSIGTIALNNLIANGSINPINRTLTGSLTLSLTNCTINTRLQLTLPSVNCGSGNQFNERVTMNLTGASTSAMTGTFARRADLTRTGPGNLSVSSSVFQDSVFARNTSTSGTFQLADNVFHRLASFANETGVLQPCAAGTCRFRGSLIIDSNTDVVMGTSPTEGLVRFEGAADQDILGTGPGRLTLHRLEVDKSAGIIKLSIPFSVATALTLTRGIIRASDTHPLRLLDGATAAGASDISHVEGPLEKQGNQAFNFPVGDGGVYRPLAISDPALPTDVFTARFVRAAQPFGEAATYAEPLVTVSRCEYWTLDRTAGSSEVFVTLGWRAADCATPYVTDPTTLHVARWNGTQWVSHGQGDFSGSAMAGTVTSADRLASFSPFALGSTTFSNPLPVELVMLEAQREREDVHVRWRTASEVRSDHFNVQRSATGTAFQTIGRVAAAGFSQTPLSYRFIDVNPPSGKWYYRLQMVDDDGTVAFSEVVSATVDEATLHVYPNPTTEVVHLTEKRKLQLSSAWGLVVWQSGEAVDTVTLPAHLSNGTYLIQTDRGEVFRVVLAR